MKIAFGNPGFAAPILLGAAFALLAGPAAAQRRPPVGVRPDITGQMHVLTVAGRVEVPLMDSSGTVRAIMVFQEASVQRPARRGITFLDPQGRLINDIAAGPRSAGGGGPPIAEIGPSRPVSGSSGRRDGLEEGRSDGNLTFLQRRIDTLEARVNALIRSVNGPQ